MTNIAIIHTIVRWEEKAIINALKNRGLKYISIDPRHVAINLNTDIGELDLVLQRSINRFLAQVTTILLEILGYRVINNGYSTLLAQNKALTIAQLYKSGLPVPKSFLVYGYDSMIKALENIQFPVVHKHITGSWGRLIGLARNYDDLRIISEYIEFIPDPSLKISLIQKYINKGDRDIRITVIGDHAYAPIYRINKNHWITNTARGGIALPAKLDPQLEDVSIKAAKSIGVDIAGIDIFEDKDHGYIVNEVNPVPEFKNVSRVTGVDIASLIVDYIIDVAKR